MSCPTAWRDGNGEHSCRHAEGHEQKRHSCVCGSWPGERDATPTDSPTLRGASSARAWGRGQDGGDVTPLLVASVHRPT